jgi:hypothetical protein
MSTLFKIIKAWVIASNPSKRQTELANLRANICDECPSKKIIIKKLNIGVVCGECGCPVAKKVFTDMFNACPLGKWEEIDYPFFNNKNDKSVI